VHLPVLLQESVELMNIRTDGMYLDGTLGGGGHAEAMLRQMGPNGRLLGIDRDAEAIERVKTGLAAYAHQCIFVQGNYADMTEIAHEQGIEAVDGILLDIGMSSFQIDDADRGFSFQKDGPLDMRMDSQHGTTAADMVNQLDADELARILWELGEERSARKIARIIVEERKYQPIKRTLQLAELVERIKGGRRSKTHPATQTFQALRIAVNDELASLDKGLQEGMNLLKPKGRMAVISFHSMEDRRVKKFFSRHVGRMESLQEGGERWLGEEPRAKGVTRKPVRPSAEEIQANARARSAKLRVIERLSDGT